MFEGGSNNDRPDIGERYTAAASTSNLTAPPEWRPTDAYVLVASGLGRKGVGGALMRLLSEWQRTAKPHRHAKLPTVAEIAANLPLVAGDRAGHWLPNTAKAKVRHAEMVAAVPEWYDAEIRMLKNRMREMPEVRDHLCAWLYGAAFVSARDEMRAYPDRKATFPAFADAEQVAAETILWWLDDTCMTCNGARWQLVPNTNRLSNRSCPTCKATGKKPEPVGDSQRMLDYLRQCIYDWRQSTGERLKGLPNAVKRLQRKTN